MIISISGLSGSGKSTVAKMLAEELEFERIYIGGILRQIAADRGITILELMKRAETDSTIDEDADKYVIDLGKQKDNFVIESRTAFHFIPDSLKIFIKVRESEAAERIWKDIATKNEARKDEETAKNPEELVAKIKERNEIDRERYRKYYGIDYLDENNYDLVIDSTNIPAKEVLERILQEVNKLDKENS